MNSEPVSGIDIMRIKILYNKLLSSVPDTETGSNWLLSSLLPFVP